MPLTNELTQSFGIEFPILQSGMAGIAGHELAVAVSNAGGLGILAGHGIGPEELKNELAKVQAGTNRPFGVNLLLPEDLVRPSDERELDISDVESVNFRINLMGEEIGLPPASGLPKTPARNVEEKLEIALAAKIPVLSIGLGNPGHALVERCHRQGTKVIVMVSSLEDAKAVAETGVDALVVQGSEAGGHRSHFVKPENAGYGLVGSMVLIPEIVDSVDIPVIAAGGIVDGRSMVAAMALGAQAVMLGTRFVATREALARQSYKQAVIDGRSDQTVVTDVASGRYARVLRNRFTDEYSLTPVLTFGWQGSATLPLFDRARELENPEFMALWAGQSAGRVNDLVGSAEVIERLVAEAEGTLAKLRA